MEKDAQREERTPGAEAAPPCVTRGKLDARSIQAVSGRTGHALWQIAPSSSLLAHPPPTPPHPTRKGALGTTSEEACGCGDSVPNPCSNLEKEWEPPLEPQGAAGSNGLSRSLFLSPWFTAAPPPRPLGLATSVTPLAPPLDSGVGGEGGRM